MLAPVPRQRVMKERESNTYLLSLGYRGEACKELLIAKASVPDHCTAALNWLNDFAGSIAGQSKAGRTAVNLHGAAQRLLSTLCHAAARYSLDGSPEASASKI